MTLTRKTLLIVAGLAFALSLLANIPAALLYTAVKPKDSRLQVHGLQGAWSAGSLSGISLNSRLLAQDLHWQLQPLQLLLGRVAVRLSGGGQIATLDGTVAVSIASQRLNNFRFTGGLKSLAAAAGYAYVPVDGQAGGELKKLVLTKAGLDYAEGSLELKGVQWTLSRDPLLLGDFSAVITTLPDAVTVAIQSPSGPLEAGGSIVLRPDQSYEADIQLKPRAGASEMLQNYLKTLGAPDAQGNYHLRQRGKLP